MNWLAQFVVTRARLAWALAVLTAAIVGIGATELARVIGERERVRVLGTAAERRGIEVMSQTLNGNLMGSLSMLGLIHADVKRDALAGTAPNDPKVVDVLENIGRSYNAESVYVIGQNGVVKSSWDNTGKPYTGLSVKFRPYFQMAMQGTSNVYGAVSIVRGERSLYFAVPVYAGTSWDSLVVGVAVARSALFKIEDLLRVTEKSDISLLLSPQGVVFVSSRREWLGRMMGQPTPERLRAIRELKQFGDRFEKEEPALLPVAVDGNLQTFEGRRYAVAAARIQWNDPFGDWTVVLLEDLTRSVPLDDRAWIGAGSAITALLFGLLFFTMLRGRFAQTKVAEQLQAHAQRQEALAQSKSRLAQASMQLQQATTLEGLAQVFLQEANQLLGVLQGAVYVVDAEAKQRLKLAAGYGAAADLPASVGFGEGLLGQCALDAKPIFMEAPTEAYWRISSGLGAIMPRMAVIVPLLRNDVVLGVVELAALKPPDADERSMLDELLLLLALNLEIALRSRQADRAAGALNLAEDAA